MRRDPGMKLGRSCALAPRKDANMFANVPAMLVARPQSGSTVAVKS
jgi:hypothetical protein